MSAFSTPRSAPMAENESFTPTPRSMIADRADSVIFSGYPPWMANYLSKRNFCNNNNNDDKENKLNNGVPNVDNDDDTNLHTTIIVDAKFDGILHRLKPFVVAGRCLGVIPIRQTYWCKWISTLHLLICVLIVTFAACRCAMSLFGVKAFDSVFVSAMALTLHFVKCLCSAYFLRRLLGPASGRFYAAWEDIVEGAHRSEKGKRQLNKPVAACCCLAVAGALTCSVAVAMATWNVLFEAPGVENLFVHPYTACLNGIVTLLASGYDFALQALYTVLCVAIYNEFRCLVRKLSDTSSIVDGQQLERHLTLLRLYHFQLMRVTDELDELVSYYAFVLLATNIPLTCAQLFVLCNETHLSSGSKMWIGFWFVKLLAEIFVTYLPASAISHMSSQPLFYIHEISNNLKFSKINAITRALEDDFDQIDLIAESNCQNNDELMNKQMFQQTFLFVEQLTKRFSGISCGGFFVITKEALLTVVSVMITYFALIMQLDLSAQFHCQCNSKKIN